MKRKIYNELHPVIKALLLSSEGWLIGEAPKAIIEGLPIKDYDIIVPSREIFQIIIATLNTYASVKINSYGGLKFNIEGVGELDIWCEELDHFLKICSKPQIYSFNMKRNILLKYEN